MRNPEGKIKRPANPNDGRRFNGAHLENVKRKEALEPGGIRIAFRITPVQRRFLESRGILSAWGRYDYSEDALHVRGAAPGFRRVAAVMSGTIRMDQSAAAELFVAALPDPVRAWLEAPGLYEPHDASVVGLELPQHQVDYLRQLGVGELSAGSRNAIDRAIVVAAMAPEQRAEYAPEQFIELPKAPEDTKRVLEPKSSRVVRTLLISRWQFEFLKSRRLPRAPHSRYPDPAGAALRLILDTLRGEAVADALSAAFMSRPFACSHPNPEDPTTLKLWLSHEQAAFARQLGMGDINDGLRKAINEVRWLVE